MFCSCFVFWLCFLLFLCSFLSSSILVTHFIYMPCNFHKWHSYRSVIHAFLFFNFITKLTLLSGFMFLVKYKWKLIGYFSMEFYLYFIIIASYLNNDRWTASFNCSLRLWSHNNSIGFKSSSHYYNLRKGTGENENMVP